MPGKSFQPTQEPPTWLDSTTTPEDIAQLQIRSKHKTVHVLSLGIEKFEDSRVGPAVCQQRIASQYNGRPSRFWEHKGRTLHQANAVGKPSGEWYTSERAKQMKDEDLMTKSLRMQRPELFPEHSAHVFVDCRDMIDPADRDKTVGKHIGTHPTIIEESLAADSWPHYVDLLHEQLHAHYDIEELYIIFVCNKAGTGPKPDATP